MKKRYYLIAIIVFFVCVGLFLGFRKISYERTCHNNIEKVMERCVSGKDVELLEKYAESAKPDDGEHIVSIATPEYEKELKEVYGSYMTEEVLDFYMSNSYGSVYAEYENVKMDSIEFTDGDSYVFDCVSKGTLNGKEETLHLHGRAQCDEKGKIKYMRLEPQK